MSRKLLLIIIITIIVNIFPSNVLAAQDQDIEDNACYTCHKALGWKFGELATNWERSVHAKNGVTCSKCHGGDPNIPLGNVNDLSTTEFREITLSSMYYQENFVGAPKKEKVQELCKLCHSEQYKMYVDSPMGALFLANKGGPSCVYCHGAHENHIPNTKICEDCHNDVQGFNKLNPHSASFEDIPKDFPTKIKGMHSETKYGGDISKLGKYLYAYWLGSVAFITLFVIYALTFFVLKKGGY